MCLQRKFGGLLGGSSGGGGAVNEDSDDAGSSGLKVRPTFGVSFGLPSGGAGGGSYPISPYGPNPSVNPYGNSLGGGNGLNLGLVSVNPLLSLQVSKDEYGEKIVKPWVNLHVTPNAGLVHKVGDIVHKLKSPHYGHGYGYGHEYPPSYLHQHNHYHVPPPPPPPSYHHGSPSYYGPSKPFYHSKPSFGGGGGGYYGAGGYSGGGYGSGGYSSGGYAPEYHSYRDDEYDDHGGYYGASGPGDYYGQSDDYDGSSFYRSSNITAAAAAGGSGSDSDRGNNGGNDYGHNGDAGSPKVAFPNDRQSTGSVRFVGGQRHKRDVDEVRWSKRNNIIAPSNASIGSPVSCPTLNTARCAHKTDDNNVKLMHRITIIINSTLRCTAVTLLLCSDRIGERNQVKWSFYALIKPESCLHVQNFMIYCVTNGYKTISIENRKRLRAYTIILYRYYIILRVRNLFDFASTPPAYLYVYCTNIT